MGKINETEYKKEDIVDLYLNGQNTKQISKYFNVTSETIRRWLKNFGIPRRSDSECRRKYSCDLSFFDESSILSSYYAGFLMADGNISDNVMQIEINQKDESILCGLKNALKYNGVLEKRTRYSNHGLLQNLIFLRITSNQLVNSLGRWGIIPNKSKFGFIPDFVSNSKFLPYFMRGLFEGDGCIGKRKNGLKFFSFCNNYKVVNFFREWCFVNTGFNAKIHKRSNVCHLIQYNSQNIINKIGKLLYDCNGPRLERKYKLFL